MVLSLNKICSYVVFVNHNKLLTKNRILFNHSIDIVLLFPVRSFYQIISEQNMNTDCIFLH